MGKKSFFRYLTMLHKKLFKVIKICIITSPSKSLCPSRQELEIKVVSDLKITPMDIFVVSGLRSHLVLLQKVLPLFLAIIFYKFSCLGDGP